MGANQRTIHRCIVAQPERAVFGRCAVDRADESTKVCLPPPQCGQQSL